MRVTEALVYGRMGRNNTTARMRLDKATQPLMTGYAIDRPSDDPLLANRIEEAKRGMRRSTMFRKNIDRTRVYYQHVETTVGAVTDHLSELQGIAISMVNGALGANDKVTIANQVGSILESMRALANTQYDGRYIFSGRLENTPAFDATDTYQGDAVGRTVTIADSYAIQSDLNGLEVFGDPAAGDPSAFQAAADLQAALLANDNTATLAALDDLKTAHQNATLAWSGIGYRLDELQRFDDAAVDHHIGYEVRESELVGADYAQAASEMQFAETVYQASLATSSKLMDILKMEARL